MKASKYSAQNYQEELYEELGSDLFADQFDVQQYLQSLRRHKIAIILFTAIVTSLAALYAFSTTPQYRSTASLLIETQNAAVPSIGELLGGDTESQDYYQTQYEILRSRKLSIRVINQLGLWEDPELLPGAGKRQSGSANNSAIPTNIEDLSNQLTTDQKKVIKSFKNRLSITPLRKTKLVEISYLSSDPELASSVANMVAHQYIESYLEEQVNRTSDVTAVLTERLSGLKSTLDESKDQLLEFKKSNGLLEVGGSVGRLNEQQLQLVTAELAEARSRLAQRKSVFDEVQSFRGRTDLLEAIPAVQADLLVQRSKIDQSQVQRELDELLNRYGQRHPRVIDATSQLQTIGATLDGHVNRVANSIINDYRLAQANVAAIEAKLDASKEDFQEVGEKSLELEQLESEVNTNQTIYDAFYSQINQVKSADGLESSNAVISDPAIAPTDPAKPNKFLIVGVAALVSLLLAMFLVLMYEQFRDTIKSSNDIEKKLGQRLLGILPIVKSGILKHSHIPVNPGLMAKYAPELTGKKKESVEKYFESVESARTALFVSGEKSSGNVLMVTSSVAGEGKSSTALALAHSLSKLERVLLIDCDLRQPTVAMAVIAKAEERANHVGLSELITGTASARDCIVRGAFGQYLDVLPTGQLPEHPLELLSSQRFRKILESVSEHYDRVILDCAPIQFVSDSVVLSKVSDAVVYCVQAEKTPVGVVNDGLQRLIDADAYIAGVVVTQADITKFAHYGSQHYYNGLYVDYTDSNAVGLNGEKLGRGKIKLAPAVLQKIQNDDSEFDLGFDTDYKDRAA